MDDEATILCGIQNVFRLLLHLLQSLGVSAGDNSKLEPSTVPGRDTTGSGVQTMLIYSLVVM